MTLNRKLIFLVTEDWYFQMHRLPQARAAKAAGFDIVVATRVNRHRAEIEAEGFRVAPLCWRRGSLNPLHALASILKILCLYRVEKPDIVHHVSLKPILFGTIAARLAKVPVIVDAFTGLGLLFFGNAAQIRQLRLLVFPLLRLALNSRRVHVLAENKDHLKILIAKHMAKAERATVIRGSGIDISRFVPTPSASPAIVAACAARMLKSKGIAVLAQAMCLLENRSPLRLLLAGTRDPESPDSLSESEMAAIASQPNIDWLGHVADMPGFWQQAHIAVLPSLTGEGLPVSLLEAAASGLPLIATDVSGCREIVVPDVNGSLVPPYDAEALAEALYESAVDADLRRRWGQASRQLVERELSADIVGQQTTSLYQRLLDAK